jgi:S1-C subfamily serine protease
MGSLFDDPRRRRAAARPPDTVPMAPPAAPPPAARARRHFPPLVAGVLVALAVAVGVAIGHEAWRSSNLVASGGGSPTAYPGLFGSGGASANGPAFGGSGSRGGSSASSGAPSTGSGAPADVSAIAAKVDPGLVDITTTFGYQGAVGAGTGIVLTANGEILTNNHVIDGASSISVTDIGNGRTYKGTVVGYDPSKDVAVVQLQNASGLTTANLGDSSTAAVGQSIVAIGNAGGAGSTPSTAGGSITRLNRSITAGNEIDGSSEKLSGLIEVNADVQPGDSGGPLVNTSGEVIGMDTAASAGFSFEAAAVSQGYAIPINQALAIVKQIETGPGSSTLHIGPTALLGVLSTGSSARGRGYGYGYGYGGGGPAGALIEGVTRGGAAEQAGLSQGDLITSLDGQAIDQPAALSRVMVGLKPGDRVALAWTDSGGQSHTATVTLGTGPPA